MICRTLPFEQGEGKMAHTFVLPIAFCLLPLALVGAEPVTPAQGDQPAEPSFLVQPYLQLPAPTGMTVMWETDRKLPSRVEYGTTKELGQAVEMKEPVSLHEVRLSKLQPGRIHYYRVRSGALVSDVFPFKTAPPPGTKRWRLALYGDSRANPRIHQQVAEQIAKANVDLIIHTGDIVFDGRNHAAWRREFFEPLGPLARSVPWISTIGNHERDSANYFSYMALPGNERYFGFDFGNAHFVCLDSNAWIEKGRDSEQYRWLTAHLREKRDSSWTFAVFHHSLFSAHVSRPIMPLRWDWAPVFLDPANKVDAVLTGHDHFYARNYRMARLADKPQPGVLFLTSAGGGATLYRSTTRDFVAVQKPVYHFTLLEFDGDKVSLTAIGVAGGTGAKVRTGEVFDRYVLTKEATPPGEFCAYEIEELRRFLRLALVAATPVAMAGGRSTTTIDTVLRVPSRFQVPVRGEFVWEAVAGWKMKKLKVPFVLGPGQPLETPLQAEVAPGAFAKSPALTIAFEEGKFRNRTVELSPFKLAGPDRVRVGVAKAPVQIDGKLEEAWQAAPSYSLLGCSARGGRGDDVRLLADKDWLYVGARLDDPADRVGVVAPAREAESSRLVLFEEHFRVILADGKHTRTFALSPEQIRYCSCDGFEDTDTQWRAGAVKEKQAWCVELAIPRKLFPDLARVRMDVVHRRRPLPKEFVDYELRPTYDVGPDPDRLPDWFPIEDAERFAGLILD
jgi:hypothetical protein